MKQNLPIYFLHNITIRDIFELRVKYFEPQSSLLGSISLEITVKCRPLMDMADSNMYMPFLFQYRIYYRQTAL